MWWGNKAAAPEYATAKIAVWWDMNDCPVPDGYDARGVRSSIEGAFKKLGYSGPVSITAFGNLAQIPHGVLRGLSSTGVGVQQTVTGINGTLMFSDILRWRRHNPPPATMMLISDQVEAVFSFSLCQLQSLELFTQHLSSEEHAREEDIIKASIPPPKDEQAKKREQLPIKSEKQVEKRPEIKGTPSASSKNKSVGNLVKEPFSVTEVKKWARDDLTQTISWLESQEEKPEPDEIKRIAAEGVLTCLQDAIDSLEQKQDIESVTELWSFVPCVVKELRKMESSPSEKENSTASKKELCKQVKSWKEIYEVELAKPGKEDSSGTKSKGTSRVALGYESDETVEMTEEEIEIAYRNVCVESL